MQERSNEMKKAVMGLALAAVLVVGQAAVAAEAHGHGCRGTRASSYRYDPCDVEGCCDAGVHQHDGTYYCGHSYKYDLCEVEDCHIVGVHQHDETYYCGHYVGDGHDYHEVCDVAGCRLTEEHEHDGHTCLPSGCCDGYGTINVRRGRGRCHH